MTNDYTAPISLQVFTFRRPRCYSIQQCKIDYVVSVCTKSPKPAQVQPSTNIKLNTRIVVLKEVSHGAGCMSSALKIPSVPFEAVVKVSIATNAGPIFSSQAGSLYHCLSYSFPRRCLFQRRPRAGGLRAADPSVSMFVPWPLKVFPAGLT